jgi:hypothetical protein
MYLANCKKCNDNHIENHNSATQYHLPENQLINQKAVSTAALTSELQRDLIPLLEAEQGIAVVSSSRGRGEVYHEETRHERGLHGRDMGKHDSFLTHYVGLLDSIDFSGVADAPRRLDQAEDPSKDMDTVAGLHAHGKCRLSEVCLPGYQKYMDGDIAKAVRRHDAAVELAQEGGADRAHLRQFHKVHLKCFLKQHGLPTSGNNPELIQRILHGYSRLEFNTFIHDHGLSSDAIADQFWASFAGIARAQRDQAQGATA